MIWNLHMLGAWLFIIWECRVTVDPDEQSGTGTFTTFSYISILSSYPYPFQLGNKGMDITITQGTDINKISHRILEFLNGHF